MEFGQAFAFLITISVLFLIFVCPVWIVMHYLTKRREAKTLLDDESTALEEFLNKIDKMEQRIDSLEQILSAEDPNWKEKVE